MKKLMLTAMHSGAGKTVMTCALLGALKRRGLDVRAFKCGPDYIDPMFHSRVLGVPCRNLDLFLQGEKAADSLARCGGEVAVLEGAMGFYDGLSGTAEASAWDLAVKTETPAILVLRPRGVGVTLAAQVRGMLDFRPQSPIAGLLLADCKSPLADYLAPILERETGLPVLGHLPPMAEAELESRHLGLKTAGEIADLASRTEALSAMLERTADIDRLLSLAGESPAAGSPTPFPPPVCRIAVARDEAFCFLYEDSLDALRRTGAELTFFSPLRDEAIPAGADGLYLCGGYPELYAGKLSENESMRASVRAAVRMGLPTVAECGGFLYLQQALTDGSGRTFPMAGALPGEGYPTDRLRRFGYRRLRPEADSMLFRAGETVPVHEFHYWDSTENGIDIISEKPGGGAVRCGFVSEHMYAAFPHLHLGGELPLAERFVKACVDR